MVHCTPQLARPALVRPVARPHRPRRRWGADPTILQASWLNADGVATLEVPGERMVHLYVAYSVDKVGIKLARVALRLTLLTAGDSDGGRTGT